MKTIKNYQLANIKKRCLSKGGEAHLDVDDAHLRIVTYFHSFGETWMGGGVLSYEKQYLSEGG